MTLLHYIAIVVKEKYTDLANFYNELHFVDKAAAGQGGGGLQERGEEPDKAAAGQGEGPREGGGVREGCCRSGGGAKEGGGAREGGRGQGGVRGSEHLQT